MVGYDTAERPARRDENAVSDAGAGTVVEHLDFTDARATPSHELNSDVVSDVADAFVDFDGGNYRIAEGVCTGRGATLSDWAVPALP